MHLVTATNATSITFWPPLPLTLTNWPTVASYSKIVRSVGFEDFSINLTNSTVCALYMIQSWGCWVRNLEVLGSSTRQMFFLGFSMGEIRNCYTHATRGSGPGHEGIDLYALNCWNLVENNLAMNGGYPAIILGNGGDSGNVNQYDSVDSIDSGSSVAGAAISVNHGPHNMFNLFEGNVGQMFQSDGYFGSASHNTVFRNHFSGTYAPSIFWHRAVDLCRWSYYFNIVGNVLGSDQQVFPILGGERIQRAAYLSLWLSKHGKHGICWDEPAIDEQRRPRHPSKGQDPIGQQFRLRHQICGKPFWGPASVPVPRGGHRTWWGSRRWPAIGPDLDPMVQSIPAQALLARPQPAQAYGSLTSGLDGKRGVS